MLFSITSKFTIRSPPSRVLSHFCDCRFSTQHFKFGKIGKCFGFNVQKRLEVSADQTLFLGTNQIPLGTALAATKCENIQIIYAQPIEYNIEGYSRPNDKCTLFDFNELVSSVS